MNDGKVFLDSNIFIYMYDSIQKEKREISLSLVDSNNCVTSTQAINEISSVLTKKIKKPVSEVLKVLEDIYLICDVKQLQKSTVFNALNFVDRYGFSYYDCLMLASAVENNCDIVYSEDMQDGQRIENKLTIINPFKHLNSN